MTTSECDEVQEPTLWATDLAKAIRCGGRAQGALLQGHPCAWSPPCGRPICPGNSMCWSRTGCAPTRPLMRFCRSPPCGRPIWPRRFDVAVAHRVRSYKATFALLQEPTLWATDLAKAIRCGGRAQGALLQGHPCASV